MSAAERDARVLELKQKLSELERQFETQARLRGFDPAQIENMALPAQLAQLLEACIAVKSELKDLGSTEPLEERTAK